MNKGHTARGGKNEKRPEGRNSATTRKAAGSESDRTELIARRAYELYQRRGGFDGDDLNDWLTAESELKSASGTGAA